MDTASAFIASLEGGRLVAAVFFAITLWVCGAGFFIAIVHGGSRHRRAERQIHPERAAARAAVLAAEQEVPAEKKMLLDQAV